MRTSSTDLLADPTRKVIVFSEWERMLDAGSRVGQRMDFEFAWHTGSVPQDKRRAEIRRFKNDPSCRLFLSTDCGSVGLNLQAANAVVNVDLPWNPAKLEQRIARAWRKNQMRTVTVVNLVCEDSIEHRILHLLAQKQDLADGVIDGRGDVEALKMPSGRAAMLERMAAFLTPPPPPAPQPAADPAQLFMAEIADRLDASVLAVEQRRREDGSAAMIVVLDGAAAADASERQHLVEAAERSGVPGVEFVDRSAWDAIRRLAEAGIIRLGEASDVLHRSNTLNKSPDAAARAVRLRRNRMASDWLDQAERKLRMAALLADGGYTAEALPPVGEAASMGLRSLAIIVDLDLNPETVDAFPNIALTELAAVQAHLPPGAVAWLASDGAGGGVEFEASRIAAQNLLALARGVLGQAGGVR